MSTVESLDQYFFGHGKLLLTGEYFVLDGSDALALPVKLGQSLSVRYEQSFSPRLQWRALNGQGDLWFEAKFEFWHFDLLDGEDTPEKSLLQKILRQARVQNPHFLREEVDVFVETKLEFPIKWGLGSSSTLIYNIAQWAYISPFELLFNTYGGSGYDIACAQSKGPIVYERKGHVPSWKLQAFYPPFKDSLYFIYLGVKQSSEEAIKLYEAKRPYDSEVIAEITSITNKIIGSKTLSEFNLLIEEHEKIIVSKLGLERAKSRYFSDFWGEVKSLGAWGGDFVLVTSDRSLEETKEYFKTRGHHIFFTFDQLILSSDKQSFNNYEYSQ